MDFPEDNLGCSQCWRQEAVACWQRHESWHKIGRLIDEPHLGMRIVECGQCLDRALVVFTEQVDWQKGDDPQCWHLMPLTRSEAEYLIGQQEAQVIVIAEEIAARRRQLVADHTRLSAPHIYWINRATLIERHD